MIKVPQRKPKFPVGDHRVRVVKVEAGKSRKGNEMLTVTFENQMHDTVKAFLCEGVDFHEEKLVLLKEACGLDPKEEGNELKLKGKVLMIRVKEQKPDEEGNVQLDVEGFGPDEGAGVGAGSTPKPSAPAQPTHPANYEPSGSDRIPF